MEFVPACLRIQWKWTFQDIISAHNYNSSLPISFLQARNKLSVIDERSGCNKKIYSHISKQYKLCFSAPAYVGNESRHICIWKGAIHFGTVQLHRCTSFVSRISCKSPLIHVSKWLQLLLGATHFRHLGWQEADLYKPTYTIILRT